MGDSPGRAAAGGVTSIYLSRFPRKSSSWQARLHCQNPETSCKQAALRLHQVSGLEEQGSPGKAEQTGPDQEGRGGSSQVGGPGVPLCCLCVRNKSCLLGTIFPIPYPTETATP